MNGEAKIKWPSWVAGVMVYGSGGANIQPRDGSLPCYPIDIGDLRDGLAALLPKSVAMAEAVDSERAARARIAELEALLADQKEKLAMTIKAQEDPQ